MTHEVTQVTIDALSDLLERERVALLDGDLDGLVRLLDDKRNLIDALNEQASTATTSGHQGELQKLQGKVARNQELLDSALQGIRSVANRMSTLHRVRRSLDTYDESGRKTTIEGLRGGSMEKRA